MPYTHPFSRRIESAREYRGMTKEELAIRLHMPYSRLCKRLRQPDDWRYGELQLLEKTLRTQLFIRERKENI